MGENKCVYMLSTEWSDYFPDTDVFLRVDKWGDLSFGSENENGFDIWITDEDFSNLPPRLQDMVYCARTE